MYSSIQVVVIKIYKNLLITINQLHSTISNFAQIANISFGKMIQLMS